MGVTKPKQIGRRFRTWARRITRTADGPMVEAARWIWLFMTNPTFQSNPTGADDGAVKTVVASYLNTMANAGR